MSQAPQIAPRLLPIWILEPGAARPHLLPLPVEALRLPDDVLGKLHRLGLTTIGQVLDLPRASLPSRFGPRLLERIDQLLGERPEMATLLPPPEPVQGIWTFDDPVDDRAVLAEVLRRLLAQVIDQLGPERATQRVECRLEGKSEAGGQRSEVRSQGSEVKSSGDGAAASLRPATSILNLALTRPTTSAAHLQELAALQLERVPLAGPMRRVVVEAQPLPRPLPRQGSLFGGDDASQRETQLAALLDRLRSRLGPLAVLETQLVDDWLPERSVRWEEAGGAGEGRSVGRDRSQAVAADVGLRGYPKSDGMGVGQVSNLSGSARSGPDRQLTGQVGKPVLRLFEQPLSPLRLYSRPLPLDVVLHHDRPLRLRWERYAEQVLAAAGPQRIETGWWRGEFIRRDYYRLTTAAGRRLWAYAESQGAAHHWFLAGE